MRLKIMLAIITFLFLTDAFAWNQQGHWVVAQIAYDQLSPAAREWVLTLTHQIVASDNTLHYQKEMRTENDFILTSSWPDYWRKLTVAQLWRRYHVKETHYFMRQREQSNQWHYDQLNRPDSIKCQRLQKGGLFTAITRWHNVLTYSHDDQCKGLAIIFLAHLYADLHQPLHNISHVNDRCESDRGGNAYCLQFSRSGFCRVSLHQWWDSGAGLLIKKMNIESFAHYIEKK
jgi:hypothetical protein